MGKTIRERRNAVQQRNFVAKNAQETGAGRHLDKKKDFRRKPKHHFSHLKEIL